MPPRQATQIGLLAFEVGYREVGLSQCLAYQSAVVNGGQLDILSGESRAKAAGLCSQLVNKAPALVGIGLAQATPLLARWCIRSR